MHLMRALVRRPGVSSMVLPAFAWQRLPNSASACFPAGQERTTPRIDPGRVSCQCAGTSREIAHGRYVGRPGEIPRHQRDRRMALMGPWGCAGPPPGGREAVATILYQRQARYFAIMVTGPNSGIKSVKT